MKRLLAGLLLLGSALAGVAQDTGNEAFADPFAGSEGQEDSSDDFGDLDSLFEDEEMIDVVEAEGDANPEDDLLVREDVRIGGRLATNFEAISLWEDYPDSESVFDPTDGMFVPQITADLFLDARPESDFRFYTKLLIDYPFEVEVPGEDGGTVADNDVAVPSIEVFELFSDFSYRERLFFRIGKSVINWGVGYFYSPADVISLTPIDPEDPEADREGPLSFRTHVPFDVHNAYFHIVAGETIADDGEIEVSELTLAPRIELFLGGVEYGLGAFYQEDLSPRAMATASGSVWDFDLFAEAVASYGSDRVFIRRTEAGPFEYETYRVEDEVYFKGTAGVRYSNSARDALIVGQYLFNGEGYRDQTVPKDLRAAFLGEGLPPAIDMSEAVLGLSDLTEAGRHYATALASLSEVLGSDLSATLLWQGNLSDGSGILRPSLSYRLFERATVTASLAVAYGEDADEFSSMGARLTSSLGVSLGSGSF